MSVNLKNVILKKLDYGIRLFKKTRLRGSITMLLSKNILKFTEINEGDFNLVGGKGYNLGIMSKNGFVIPDGFCVTTYAFSEYLKTIEDHTVFKNLETLDCKDVEAVRVLGKEIRQVISNAKLSKVLAGEIESRLKEFGEDEYYAVRSSATAEDLPSMSFAGQQDTYLNIKGFQSILHYITSCWASLYTDRAIMYRAKNSIRHDEVLMCVVIQKMIIPEVSGIMFTADPLSENRNMISIDASYGLGEALVSGLVSPDIYKYNKKSGEIVSKDIAEKKMAIRPIQGGGTYEETIEDDRKRVQAISDEKIIGLAKVAEKIENYYNMPQDIEWAIDKSGDIFITQSRPITSLFPKLEDRTEEGDYRVYIGFNYIQVMMNSFKPLGTSFIKMVFPVEREGGRPDGDSTIVKEVAGRVFLDITDYLSTSVGKKKMPKGMKNIDVQMAEAIAEVVSRDEFNNRNSKEKSRSFILANTARKFGARALKMNLSNGEGRVSEADEIVRNYIISFEKEMVGSKDSVKKLKIIRKNITGYLAPTFYKILPMIIPGMISYSTLVKMSKKKLESDALAQKLVQGLVGNVTTEMGLEMGDIAELFRENNDLLAMLKNEDHRTLINKLMTYKDKKVSEPISDFMHKNGARGIGEIDITAKRWFEDSTALVQSIENHLNVNEPNEHRIKYEKLVKEAEEAGEELIRQLGKGPIKKKIVAKHVKNVRNLMPIREHGKYGMIRCFGIAKQFILEEANKLVEKGLIKDRYDVYYMSMDELIDCIENSKDYKVITNERKEAYNQYKDINPPRVLTSDGEIVRAAVSNEDAPEGVIVGNPVSAGVIEGTAKVVLDPTEAVLNKGEILIAPFTDPGWTPLFINAEGLVLEVGGLLTHGAVVAREYGMPAVVGVNDATKIIKNGDKIRVDGNKGYIEIID